MLISEAMRAGIKETGPIPPNEDYGATRMYGNGPMGEHLACALGAVIVGAVGWDRAVEISNDAVTTTYSIFPRLGFNPPPSPPNVPPPPNDIEWELQNEICRLNDACDMSRESIADWLEKAGL